MFQIIYRRIYLLYVVMDSFDMACSEESQHLTFTLPQLKLLLYFPFIFFILYSTDCPIYAFKMSSRYALHHSAILHNAEVLEHCVSAAGKTSVMQPCCHLRVTNRQWQTIRKGERVEWCR